MSGTGKKHKHKLPLEVVKRDGRVMKFDAAKIVQAITKAVAETGEFETEETERMAEIVKNILARMNTEKAPFVEEIQDVVEQVLMAGGHYETAKAYIIYRARRAEERDAVGILGVEDDLGLSINQLRVIEKRYLIHNEDGEVIETPKEWLTRVARTLAKVEKKKRKEWEKEFFEVMASFKFLPAGRTLNNAGTKQNQLANCFVLPVEDSIEGIFEAVKWTALVHQTGGGTGFNFSKLRPSGDAVTKSAGGFATGPVSFMKVFDVATRQVMRGGKKRGANMGILNVDHPDIMEFINCKAEEGEIANFNISVGMTDEFMKAVKKDGEFTLKNPRTGEGVQTIKARTLMDQIAMLAWRTGDPGLINLDAINRNNPLEEKYGRIEATNPCGEQPLHPFDACNLGSINLAAFVKRPNGVKLKKMEQRIDWVELARVVRLAVRMLDNVIDVCNYPLKQITETVRANRRIGLGIMGWADMLFQLRVSYNSEEGLKLARKVMAYIQAESWEASRELAKEKGEFPRWKESAFAKGWNPLTKKMGKGKDKWKVRNVAITTIAPTGSISMAADTSSGIEPVFALSFVKNVVSDDGLTYVNKYFEEVLKANFNEWERNKVASKVAQQGSLMQIEEVPSEIKQVFVTAHDIDWEWHVKMQAAFQEFTDNAVSKTINFPKSASIEEVKSAYMLAWELGCKGITVYRDASKSMQVLSTGREVEEKRAKSKGGKDEQDYLIQSKIKVKTLKERQLEQLRGGSGKVKYEKCMECGGKVSIQEGCVLCLECGWSVCG